MLNPWLALEAGADPAERAGAVRRAHQDFLSLGTIGLPVRNVVADSWRRCAGARVAPDGLARVDLTADDLAARRAEHPLAGVMPLIRDILGTVAEDGAHLLSVGDETGRMLWVEGHAQVRRRAERMNFVPGSRWAEPCTGTNAPGTALAVDHAVQIFAAEHYCHPVQRWTCAAAPIHHPRSRRIIGVVDITGGDHLASPQSLALVQATARAAESHLAALDPAPPRSHFAVLGRDEALLRRGDAAPLRLGRRQSEILVLLAARPDGLSGEQLAVELYGDRDVTPVTLRAELSRMRGLLGEVLASRPYRLTRPFVSDLDTVRQALADGDRERALAAYRGPLLPSSEAPGVVRLRRGLEDGLRTALLSSPDAGLLEDWARTPWGEDDLAVWEALLGALPPTARSVAADRVDALRGAYGLPAESGPGPGGGAAPGATFVQRRRS